MDTHYIKAVVERTAGEDLVHVNIDAEDAEIVAMAAAILRAASTIVNIPVKELCDFFVANIDDITDEGSEDK